MKNKTNHITNMRILLSFTTVAALCTALSVRAGKPSHGGGGSGGLPYATASTVSELVADINYANGAGGATTINLAPGTNFVLTSVNNSTTNGNDGLPVIGGTKAVNLTIICNGDTIECADVYVPGKRGTLRLITFRQFDVAAGSSLTLDNVILEGGSAGAVFNQGTLNVINGSTLSGIGSGSGCIYNDANGTVTVTGGSVSGSAEIGGAIYNNGGTVTVSDCALGGYADAAGGGIANAGGTMTISDSNLSGSSTGVNGDLGGTYGGAIYNSGAVTINNSIVGSNSSEYGGAIANFGGTVTFNNSTVTNNSAFFDAYDNEGGEGGAIYSSAGTVVINQSILSGNTADVVSGDDYSDGGLGGGIYNNGTATVENSSSITGNGDDVLNSGTLYEDGSSVIGVLFGNPAIPF